MVSIVDSQKSKVDRLLWGIVLALIITGIWGYYHFSQQSTLLRIVGFLAVISLAIAIGFKTTKGRNFWTLWLESIQEVRKIYWPTRQETIQTTLAVLAMVVVMGIILWTTDFILLKVVAWLTGHWGA